jgi:hypothetical protein
MPSDLEEALAAFVKYYNYRRYHKALGNVTPANVLEKREGEVILTRRKEVQREIFQRRRQYNQQVRDALNRAASSPSVFGHKVST